MYVGLRQALRDRILNIIAKIKAMWAAKTRIEDYKENEESKPSVTNAEVGEVTK